MYLLIQQVFDVYSCHVCPGGCKRPSVPLIPVHFPTVLNPAVFKIHLYYWPLKLLF